MFAGDHSRKQNLVDYGFRLPSALDNRPLTFAEFTQRFKQVIFVSATPADYELHHSQQVVEQIIRPTGLLDPVVSEKVISLIQRTWNAPLPIVYNDSMSSVDRLIPEYYPCNIPRLGNCYALLQRDRKSVV